MQQSLEGPALKLWANPRCPATFPQGFLSMYLIAGSEGLEWPQNRRTKKQIEEQLFAPPQRGQINSADEKRKCPLPRSAIKISEIQGISMILICRCEGSLAATAGQHTAAPASAAAGGGYLGRGHGGRPAGFWKEKRHYQNVNAKSRLL